MDMFTNKGIEGISISTCDVKEYPCVFQFYSKQLGDVDGRFNNIHSYVVSCACYFYIISYSYKNGTGSHSQKKK